MKELKLVILIEVKPGKAQEQINLYEKIKPLVLKEEGCLQYELNRVEGSDVNFILIERWKSAESLALHDEMPYMKEVDSISPSFRARPATVFKLNNL
jgi:quinol monooxygenase YgiN